MPLVFRKWCFHLSGRSRLLSFCKVEHAIGLQKVVFPSFWALEAHVVRQRRTCHWSSESSVSIFLQAVTRCESKPCTSLVPRQELETGLHCTPASCIYSKRGANAMTYLRYKHRRKKVPPACRGRCLKGCKQSWYETHAAQNLGIHELNYNTHVVAKGVSNFLCFTVVYSIILYTITQHYIDYYNIM